MTRSRLQVAADRRSDVLRRRLAEEVARLMQDSGVSQRALAAAAGIAQSHLSEVIAAAGHPSLETYGRIAAVLGADLSAHVYPNTGPLLRDRHQARMLEALLGALHPRWHAFTELAVRRPSRGWIDAALLDPAAAVLVATELQSDLRRLEQIIRWTAEKVASLPSWDGWAELDSPATSQLLVVRRTRATRSIAAEFDRQLRAAYPAHPDDALAALMGTTPWPGGAIVWAAIEPGGARLVGGR